MAILPQEGPVLRDPSRSAVITGRRNDILSGSPPLDRLFRHSRVRATTSLFCSFIHAGPILVLKSDLSVKPFHGTVRSLLSEFVDRESIGCAALLFGQAGSPGWLAAITAGVSPANCPWEPRGRDLEDMLYGKVPSPLNGIPEIYNHTFRADESVIAQDPVKRDDYTPLNEDPAEVLLIPVSLATNRIALFVFESDKQGVLPGSREKIQDEIQGYLFLLSRFYLALNSLGDTRHPFIIGTTGEWKEVEHFLLQSARYNFPVYISGERGTGKEVSADFIHFLSTRSNGPYRKVDCSTTAAQKDQSLFETDPSERTGEPDNPGLFESCEGGTLLLDNVEALTGTDQKKLLRILENGSTAGKEAETRNALPANVRIISVSSKPLEKQIERNEFRADLFDRLNVVKISMPPLRRWKGQLSILTDVFLRYLTGQEDISERQIDDSVIKVLEEYDFPGNCRELRQIIRRICLRGGGDRVRPGEVRNMLEIRKSPDRIEDIEIEGTNTLEEAILTAPDPNACRNRAEYFFLKYALEKTEGDVSKISRMWNCTRQNIYRLCRKHDISPSDFQ